MLTEIPTHSGRAFDLEETLHSGQVFHWQSCEWEGRSGYIGCIGDREATWLRQIDNHRIETMVHDAELVQQYLGLNHDLDQLAATYPQGDAFLNRAIAEHPGLRILHQPIWECLATFITSSLKQVAHIRSISLTLRERFGEPRVFADGTTVFTYPTPAAIVEAGEEELRKCSLGYRARSLYLAAKAVEEKEIDLDLITGKELPTSQAREELTKLHGVGEKIANCTLLFSCERWETFPIDVWIERVLRRAYRKRVKGAKLQLWAEKYFGPNAGYAQQYLFHFARTQPDF